MKDDYILIVDDELPIREMIHTSLDMAGFQCLQAEDAKQAHQMIVDQRPALILLDWMMPGGVSGVDLCRRLKRDENLSEIPVIMLTARGVPTPVHNFLTKSGAETCILKTVPSTCIFAVYVKCLSLMLRIALCKQFGVQAIDSLHVRISP